FRLRRCPLLGWQGNGARMGGDCLRPPRQTDRRGCLRLPPSPSSFLPTGPLSGIARRSTTFVPALIASRALVVGLTLSVALPAMVTSAQEQPPAVAQPSAPTSQAPEVGPIVRADPIAGTG